jgi:hypothetical protein
MKGFLRLDFILFSLSKPECSTKKSFNLHLIIILSSLLSLNLGKTEVEIAYSLPN